MSQITGNISLAEAFVAGKIESLNQQQEIQLYVLELILDTYFTPYSDIVSKNIL